MRHSIMSAVVVAGFALVGLVGCGAQSGKTVITQSPTGEPIMLRAPETGTYALYTATSANPTMTAKLNEGDQLGFRKTPDGRLEGVAGDQTTTLGKMTAQAYWKLQK